MSFILISSKSLPSYADGKEAVIAHVSLYNEEGRCPCYKEGDKECSTVYNSWSDDFANYLGDKVEAWYSNNSDSRVGRPSNMGVGHSKWADSNVDPAGNDNAAPYGVDSFDVAFLYSHGNDDNDIGGSKVVMGSPSSGGDCSLTYGGSDSTNQQDVEWGDGDLNYLNSIFLSLVDWYQSAAGWYFDESVREPDFSMMLGFDGYSIAGSAYYDRFKGFVNGVQWSGLGEDWVDEVTHKQDGDDICATAYIYAENGDDADHIYQYGGFEDFEESYAGEGMRRIHWISGCNPAGGPAMPN